MTRYNGTHPNAIRGILFIESDCVRHDLLRVYKTLSEALLEAGIDFRVLAGPGSDQEMVANYNFQKLDFWDLLAHDSRKQLRRLCAALNPSIVRRAIQQHRNPRKMAAFLISYERSKRYIDAVNTHFILGIKFGNFTSLVDAAISRGVSTYAIEHSAYPDILQQKKPHEWPSEYIFCWSKQNVSEYSQHFAGLDTKFIFGGPIWSLRHDSTPARANEKVLLLESDDSLWSDSFVHDLLAVLGEARVALKPHPYAHRQGISLAHGSFPLLCDLTGFWEQKPKLAISLGSSSTHELIYLGVPVVTIRPKAFDRALFPEIGTFSDSAESRNMAIATIVDILADPKIESKFINRQRAELEIIISEATGTLQRITDFVLEQASTAQRRP